MNRVFIRQAHFICLKLNHFIRFPLLETHGPLSSAKVTRTFGETLRPWPGELKKQGGFVVSKSLTPLTLHSDFKGYTKISL